MGNTDRRRFGDRDVGNGRRLDLSRSNALAGKLDRIVGAAQDKPGAVVVNPRPVTVIPDVITVTVTTPGDAPISTSDPVISIPDSGSFPSMPAYASPCGDFIAYESACSCFGYPPSTLAFPTPVCLPILATISSPT